MTLKVVCYGVRPNEVPFFEKLNKYNFELRLVEELLTHDNINTAEGMDAAVNVTLEIIRLFSQKKG